MFFLIIDIMKNHVLGNLTTFQLGFSAINVQLCYICSKEIWSISK
jgi:hypothetical protein